MTRPVCCSGVSCAGTAFGVNEDGDVVVTFYSSTSIPKQMTTGSMNGIVNLPLLASMMRLARDNVVPETPLWYAFEYLGKRGGVAVLCFEKSDAELGAAA